MYQTLLAIHSLVRWLVLISLVFATFRAYTGWKYGKVFSSFDNKIRHITATNAHIQLILGLWLYFISPLTDYFIAHFSEAVHQRQLRFFGMEHITVMFVAIMIITIGSAKAKRRVVDTEKFSTLFKWYFVGLLLILSSIPWSFSPLTSRPLFRSF